MPRSLPRFSLSRAARRAGPVGLLHGEVHHLLELAGVNGELGGRDVRQRRGWNEIDAADRVRRHSHLARRRIDQPLDHVGGFRPAGAAIGADRNGVGAHTFTLTAIAGVV